MKLSCVRVDLMLFFPVQLVELEQICAYELVIKKTCTKTKQPPSNNSQNPHQNETTDQTPPKLMLLYVMFTV